MKLRTKFQDETFELGEVLETNRIIFTVKPKSGGLVTFYYATLKELNDEWEDYDSTEMTVKCTKCGKLFKIPKLNDEDNVYGICPDCQIRHLIWH